ncbi:hypothetical protein HYU14_05590 [Candidatus Woesearchaeota archaeon]|nr:hypothetical protein [Candidatus Woesearchaeota archaeon]
MARSQVGLEMMFAFALMTLLLLVLFGFSFTISADQQKTKAQVNQEHSCWALSSLITSAFVGGSGLTLNTTLAFSSIINDSFSTSEKGIMLEKASCLLNINQVDNEVLEAGAISITNSNNYIEVRNV